MEHNEFQASIFKRLMPEASLDDIFYQYDFWEEFDPLKNYERKIHCRKFKNRIRNYVNVLCSIEFIPEHNIKYYVLSERYRPTNEKLIPFCPCFKCSCSRINPLKYVFCECCVGCLKSGEYFSNKNYLHEAKETLLSKKKKINKVKVFEIIFALTVTSGLIYTIF